MARRLLGGALVACSALVVFAAAPADAAELVEVRIGHHPTFTRVVFEFDAPTGYRLERHAAGEGENTILVTLDAAASPRNIESRTPGVKSVSVEAGFDAAIARIVMRKSDLPVKEMILTDPPRIVFDLLLPAPPPAAKKIEPAPAVAQPTPEPAPDAAETTTAATGGFDAAAAMQAAEAQARAAAKARAAEEAAEAEARGIAEAEARAAADAVALAAAEAEARAAEEAAEAKARAIAEAEALAAAEAAEARAAEEAADAVALAAAEAAEAEAANELDPSAQAEDLAAAENAEPGSADPMDPAADDSRDGSELAAADAVDDSAEALEIPPPAGSDRANDGWEPMPVETADSTTPQREYVAMGAIAGGVLALLLMVFLLVRGRRPIPNDMDVTALADAEEADAPSRSTKTVPLGSLPMDPASGGVTHPADDFDFGTIEEPNDEEKPIESTQATGVGSGLFHDAPKGKATTMENQDMTMHSDSEAATQLGIGAGLAGASGDSDVVALVQELERRMTHLETRLDESVEARDRLERQLAAQSEELRVQRAAIARTQRALRSLNRSDEEQATEPALRDPANPAGRQ